MIPPLEAVSFTMIVFWIYDTDEYQYLEWQGARRLDAAQAFGELWHDTYWIQFLTVSDEDARGINETSKRVDSIMQDDVDLDPSDDEMGEVPPKGLPPRYHPPTGPVVVKRGRSPPSKSPSRSRSTTRSELPAIPEENAQRFQIGSRSPSMSWSWTA